MSLKSLQFFGIVALAAAALHAQPVSGPVYWSSDSNLDCSDVEGPVTVTNSSGGTIGYSCYISGVFVWSTAGGEWNSVVRTAAPASNPVGVDLSFYDTNGNAQTLATTTSSGVLTGSGTSTGATTNTDDVNFALAVNQPAQVNLLNASQGGSGAQQTGSAYIYMYCPDDVTCVLANAQLIYSALPTEPWSLSVPVSWDGLGSPSTQWSAEAIDDNNQNRVSLVVYNENTNSAQFNVDIYNTAGNLVATGTTPSIAGANSTTYEGGTYGALLRDIPGITKSLPSGTFKILVDGGADNYSSVEVLQINGQSATTLQVAYDVEPGTSTAAVARHRTKMKVARPPKAVHVFPALPQQ